MIKNPKFYVSCKVAIFDETYRHVLVVHYGPHGIGLPGGHLDENEEPDVAMRRELFEELGFAPDELVRKDFFMHEQGKVILGYVGEANINQKFTIDPEEVSAAGWLSLDEIRRGETKLRGTYQEFVLRCLD